MSERLHAGDIRTRSVFVAMLALAALAGAVIWAVRTDRSQPMTTNAVTSAASSLAASNSAH